MGVSRYRDVAAVLSDHKADRQRLSDLNILVDHTAQPARPPQRECAGGQSPRPLHVSVWTEFFPPVAVAVAVAVAGGK